MVAAYTVIPFIISDREDVASSWIDALCKHVLKQLLLNGLVVGPKDLVGDE